MRGRFTLALAMLAGAFLFAAQAAPAAPVTKTLNFPLSGSSNTSIFNKTFSCCGIDVDLSPLFEIHSDIHGGLSFAMSTTMNAPTHNDLTFTDTNLRQGSQLDLTNTFAKDAGTFKVGYTLGANFSAYGLVDITVPSITASDTLACSLPLSTDTCSHALNVPIADVTLIDGGDVFAVEAEVHAIINTTASLASGGVGSHRTLTAGGGDLLAPTDLLFTSSPQAKDETANVPCSLPAGSPVNYAMGNESVNITGTVGEGFGLGGSVVEHDFISGDNTLLSINEPNLFTTPPKAFNTITLTAPGQNVDLGTVLADLDPPTADPGSGGIYSGVEGAQVAFDGSASSDPHCGPPTLSWDWGDGSSATTGAKPTHVYQEEGTYTGTLTATNGAGLTDTASFTVNVGDASLTAAPANTLFSGNAFCGVVTTFTDANPFATTADFTSGGGGVTVAWGDGSTSSTAASTLTVAGSGSGPYTVSGCHTFSATATQGTPLHVRMHYSDNSTGGWSKTSTVTPLGNYTATTTINDDGGSTASTTSIIQLGTPLTISGSMEGNVPIKAGDTIKAGYDYSITGAHPLRNNVVFNAQTTLKVQCPNGSTVPLTISMTPNPSFYTDPAGSPAWLATGVQTDPLSYQGQVTVPAGACAGATGHAPAGVTFTGFFGQV